MRDVCPRCRGPIEPKQGESPATIVFMLLIAIVTIYALGEFVNVYIKARCPEAAHKEPT